MLVSLVVALASGSLPNPQQVVKQALTAQANFSGGRMHYELRSRVKGRTTIDKGDIDYRRESLLAFRVDDDSYGKQSSRIYRVEGSHITAYDNFSDEVIHLSAPSTRSLPARILYRFPIVLDPVQAVADPAWLQTFFKGQGKISEFKVRQTSSGWTLEKPGKGGGDTTRLTFNRKFLLTGVSLSRRQSFFSWGLNYSSKVSPVAIPTGGREVSAFHPHQPLPDFEDVRTRELALKVRRAERKLGPSQIVITRPTSRTSIYWSRGRIRQSDPHSSWSFDGQRLQVLTHNIFYQGKASRADALNYLAKLTNGEELLSRAYLLQSNPFDDFFIPSSTVRIAGEMAVQGVPSTALEIVNKATRSTLIVKDANMLVERAWTDTLGPGGRVLQHDEASFQYLPLPGSSSEIFNLRKPARAKTRPLPKDALRYGSVRLRR